MSVAFIDEHWEVHGVEPICEQLQIALSIYYERKARERDPERRARRVKRNQRLEVEIRRVWRENFGVYGARKVWRQLLREGISVCQRRINTPHFRRSKFPQFFGTRRMASMPTLRRRIADAIALVLYGGRLSVVELGEVMTILELHRQGLSISAIAARLSIDRKTVRKYIQAGVHVPRYGPRAHRAYAGWSPQRLVRWAEHSGPATARVVATILASRPHPQQGFRSCLGIMRLGKHYGDARLEAACERALRLGAPSYKSLESILRQGLERTPLPETDTASSPQPIEHANLRGADYYH